MASADRRLTYGTFAEVNSRKPTLEDIEDGFVMCACGATLSPSDFEYYTYQCERCEKRSIRPMRPDVPRVLGTSEDPERPALGNVTELPIGKYDAVRTLRHLLALAEKGEIDGVVVVCRKEGKKGDDHWATWSDMRRMEVWWLAGWFHGFIHRRYFGGHHYEEGEDD